MLGGLCAQLWLHQEQMSSKETFLVNSDRQKTESQESEEYLPVSLGLSEVT